ncbi:hypothetical protein TVAG_121330 [Trichomonas vaginalis G3]|uniref:Uncharacterized protein n=1 Tax=Trichomonas vaginalis (strain ATCC PRA-98 / G3) TaxID=412133 RepID=A2G0E0_TRIV3|nr:hypothetical protein TVAGG3_1008690 [Trichomonas vaginalis G3]EAX89389.1 hypothetical protein TVAG_121330 [Trichomonas vaginalis G3]KAI5491319.1 hypothetical protein TVAGG3_1008690 [Trichomonas vaginalis G3]|eukprot:XP_001302319.1 hypothetical protein [Trichomonas vaginalis G3]
MSQVAAQAAIKTLFDLYWKAKPESKQLILERLANSGNHSLIIGYLSNQWKDISADASQIPQGLNFLSQYTICIKDKMTPQLAQMIFAIYLNIVKQNPIPISYDNYSKFLSIILAVLKAKNQQVIMNQLSQLDWLSEMFPMAHCALFFQEDATQYVKEFLALLNKATSTTALSTWNETLCVLLRAKISSGYDKLVIFSSVDMTLALNGSLESKIDVLLASYRYFNIQEISQIMKIHFEFILQKVTLKIPLTVISKLISLAILYFDNCDNKDLLISLVFRHLFVFLQENNSQVEIFAKFCQKLSETQINTIFKAFANKLEYTVPLLYIASNFPTQETFSILISDVPNSMRDIQYKYFKNYVMSDKFNKNQTIYLFSLLNSQDFDIIEKVLANDKVLFMVNMVRYLQNNTDRDKIFQIIRILQKYETFPIIQIDEIIDCVASLISAYFMHGIEENEITILFNYFDHCRKGIKGDFIIPKNEKQTYPTYVKDFFSSRKDWKNIVHDRSLSRIRKAEKSMAVTMIALADEDTAFLQGVAFTKDDMKLLAAYFTAASTNFGDAVLQYIEKNVVKQSGLLGGIFTAKIVDKEILRVALYTFKSICSFIAVTDSLLNILLMLFNENFQNPLDVSLLLKITKIIFDRFSKRIDNTTLIDKLCDMCEKVDSVSFEQTMISLLKSNNDLSQKGAEKVCKSWITVLINPQTPLIEKSDFEKEFLEKNYYQITNKIFVENLTKILSEKCHNDNIFMSFKRYLEIDNASIRKYLYIFIGNLLQSSKIISKFAQENVRQITNVTSYLPDNMDTNDAYEKSLPFFNELIVRLAFNFEELFEISENLLKICDKPFYELSLFYFSLAKHSGKYLLVNQGNLLMKYLSLTSNSNSVIEKYNEQIILNLFDSYPKLLMNLLLFNGQHKPTEAMYDLLTKIRSFPTTFFDISTNLIETETLNMNFVFRLSKFFFFALNSRQITVDYRCYEVFLLILTLSNLFSNDENFETVLEQTQVINSISNILLKTEMTMKTGESGYLQTVGLFTKNCYKNLQNSNDQLKLLQSIAKYSKSATLFFMNTCFVVWSFAIFNDNKLLENVSIVLSDKRLTKTNHCNLLKVLCSKVTNDTFKNVTQNVIKSFYNSFVICSTIIDKKNSDFLSKGFILIYNNLDNDLFKQEKNNILEIVRKLIVFSDSKIYEKEDFLVFLQKFIKLSEMQIPVCFPDIFFEMTKILLQTKDLKLFKICYGNDIDVKKIYKDTAALVGQKYVQIAQIAINTFNSNNKLNIEDLTILNYIVSPLSSLECDRLDVLDQFAKILKNAALTGNDDLAVLAINMLADLV